MSGKVREVIKVDPEKCTACHRCISVCPAKMCNDASGDYIKVNPELCIGCGRCISACHFGARKGVDDFDKWMAFLDFVVVLALFELFDFVDNGEFLGVFGFVDNFEFLVVEILVFLG
jgi:ferredoxin